MNDPPGSGPNRRFEDCHGPSDVDLAISLPSSVCDHDRRGVDDGVRVSDGTGQSIDIRERSLPQLHSDGIEERRIRCLAHEGHDVHALASQPCRHVAAQQTATRRSIYVLNKRNKRNTMMNTFDTPDLHNSCAQRDVTTTPIQALALLNGDWTVSRAERFAGLVLSDERAGVERRIAKAFRMALGRMPADQDIVAVRALLEAAGSEGKALRSAWVDVCHVLLNTNEFIYVN